MSSWFGGSKTPTPTVVKSEPAQITPEETREQERRRLRRHKKDTILTSPFGIAGPAETKKKVLLGE